MRKNNPPPFLWQQWHNNKMYLYSHHDNKSAFGDRKKLHCGCSALMMKGRRHYRRTLSVNGYFRAAGLSALSEAPAETNAGRVYVYAYVPCESCRPPTRMHNSSCLVSSFFCWLTHCWQQIGEIWPLIVVSQNVRIAPTDWVKCTYNISLSDNTNTHERGLTSDQMWTLLSSTWKSHHLCFISKSTERCKQMIRQSVSQELELFEILFYLQYICDVTE